ncbi:GMC family oxidoreductase [Thalassotalea nanhaiensis]|uniref:GMC family oxidoreductase n=1 Tax=Thalassotalea nanhaiensis TaxID=3065648 RepID=A0ABY9TIE3_9GAMM|nr:GMC family oxidoreductase [Colwelliaceae bacterium SQ345]
MISDGKSLIAGSQIEADICIVGAGPAGIVLALELEPFFSKIVLVESGSDHYVDKTQQLYQAESFPEHFPDPLISRLRFLGGASNHWANNTSPLSPIDFEYRNWIPNSGWPISFDDIEPYYYKASTYCGVGNDGFLPDKWMKKYHQKDWGIQGSALEIGIAKAAQPPTNFYLSNATQLINSSKIHLIKNANLVDMEYSLENKKVSNLSFNALQADNFSVSANDFVLCLGGIENARMLLFFNDKYQNKLGNITGNVGRYFMDHPTVKGAQLFSNSLSDFPLFSGVNEYDRRILSYFQLSERSLKDNLTTNLRLPLVKSTEYMLSDGISSFHILKDALQEGEFPDQLPDHLLNFVLDFDMVAEAISRKSFDHSLFDSSKQMAGFQIPMMIEQTPHRDNKICLGNEVDVFGIPKINIHWELKSSDINNIWKSLTIFANEVGTNSIGRVRLLKERSERIFNDQIGFGNHHMGTTRMANNETDGVVDKNHKVFGTENLYIGGSSVFPTGGHVPPTLTIVSLSIRLAKLLKVKYFGK